MYAKLWEFSVSSKLSTSWWFYRFSSPMFLTILLYSKGEITSWLLLYVKITVKCCFKSQMHGALSFEQKPGYSGVKSNGAGSGGGRPGGWLFHQEFFSKKGILSELYIYFLFSHFTDIIWKSLCHLFCPTSTVLHNEIHSYMLGMFVVANIVEPRLSQNKVLSMQKEHAHPIQFCLRRNCTVPFPEMVSVQDFT